ncbi:MAG TPA: class I SAM-dependent methyltransferase, partial [Actinomycetota bacterium]|nr:class I SAM-dependent methyltransferase [Actinomycetota bacterium]
GCFDDWAESYARRARRRRLGAVSNDLLRGLEDAGLRDRTILDVGCGAGGLLLEALDRGARVATGFDLSTASIEQARLISSERGLGDRATFAVADGSAAPLDAHDVVVLDKVFCCFADADRLLTNTLQAAGSVYAFSVPPSVGLRGAACRALARLENAWHALRPRRYGGFRAHVHDVGALEAGIRAAGFRPAFARRRLWWDVRVYGR